MKYVNLTPHTLNIAIDESNVLVLSASGSVARCAVASVQVGGGNGEPPLYRVVYGDVSGLPEPAPDTIFVVSALVRLAVPARQDVASPGDLIRDSAGQPIGCRGLNVN